MKPEKKRQRDPEGAKRDILAAATAEFASRGFAGARVDEIASLTQTTKRMIYYYFESKVGLYVRVLEQEYLRIRRLERGLDISGLDPVAALRELAETTFDHHQSNPDFIRLVSAENIQRAEFLAQSEQLSELASSAVTTLEQILSRGREAGLFRTDLDALDVHMLISSFSVFPVANGHTFRTLFGRDLLDPDRQEHFRSLAGDLVVAVLTGQTALGRRAV